MKGSTGRLVLLSDLLKAVIRMCPLLQILECGGSIVSSSPSPQELQFMLTGQLPEVLKDHIFLFIFIKFGFSTLFLSRLFNLTFSSTLSLLMISRSSIVMLFWHVSVVSYFRWHWNCAWTLPSLSCSRANNCKSWKLVFLTLNNCQWPSKDPNHCCRPLRYWRRPAAFLSCRDFSTWRFLHWLSFISTALILDFLEPAISVGTNCLVCTLIYKFSLCANPPRASRWTSSISSSRNCLVSCPSSCQSRYFNRTLISNSVTIW